MKNKLNIKFDYDRNGLAYEGLGGTLGGQYSYSIAEGLVYTWRGYTIPVKSEADAKKEIEWDIVRFWPGKVCDIYRLRFMNAKVSN